MRILQSRLLATILILLALVGVGSAARWWLTSTGGVGTDGTELDRRLARLQTVQGRLTITLQGVALEQKLWVQPPNFLRTETESGPSGFAGTIVVLNDQEGWVYSRALNRATVVDRRADETVLTGEIGTGSLLERMPTVILSALRNGNAYHQGERAQMLGRAVTRYEIVIEQADPAFPPGVLQVWLDDQFAYPLAWRDSQGRELRFSSIEFNRTIDPVTFVFYPPPGAAVQRISPTP